MFVIPFIVILGWAIGHPIGMLFDPLESGAVFMAVWTTSYVVQDGKSNWLEGASLCMLCV
jgi:Ca2+:H+ antiporter